METGGIENKKASDFSEAYLVAPSGIDPLT